MNFLSLFKRELIYRFKKKISIDSDTFENKSLDDLLYFYGSDKAEIFKLRGGKGHGFSKYYSNHLKLLRNKKINILEIGSYAGASAAAFKKYFKNASIFCFDINISNFKYHSSDIHVFGIDIKNKIKVKTTIEKIFLENNFNQFDLIIDDGSHNLSDILLSLKQFFKHLKNNSFFIIEDYKHPNYYEYNKDVDDILIDKLIFHLKDKTYFNSSFFSKEEQLNLIKSIDEVYTYKGNLDDSDICFLKKTK